MLLDSPAASRQSTLLLGNPHYRCSLHDRDLISSPREGAETGHKQNRHQGSEWTLALPKNDLHEAGNGCDGGVRHIVHWPLVIRQLVSSQTVQEPSAGAGSVNPLEAFCLWTGMYERMGPVRHASHRHRMHCYNYLNCAVRNIVFKTGNTGAVASGTIMALTSGNQCGLCPSPSWSVPTPGFATRARETKTRKMPRPVSLTIIG